MQTARAFKRLFAHLFHKKKSDSTLTDQQKKELTLHYLSQAELALLKENPEAFSLFEAASQLDAENPHVWYRQGLALVEYGLKEGHERALSFASKCFKTATSLDPQFFDAWVAWGDAFWELGNFHEEHHFFLEAKEKYQQALTLSSGQPSDALAQVHWNYGLVWLALARHSGEAIDVRFAIQAFQASLSHQGMPTAEFLTDYGNAYFQLGLLLNDSQFYLQAIDYFRHATHLQPLFCDGWDSMANAFSQLYLNTADERWRAQASEAFAKAVQISPKDSSLWLSWGQLMMEAGRLNKNPKQLQSAREKCLHAYRLQPKDATILAQWIESTALLGAQTSRLDLLIEAEERITHAVAGGADDPSLWYAYGTVFSALGRYYLDPEYYEMAIERLQTGLSLDRSDAELWHQLALAHQQCAELTGDLDLLERATRFFMRAMDLKPSCAALTFDAANALFLLSEYEGYAPCLQQALILYETILQQNSNSLLYRPEWLFQYACALDWLGEVTDDAAHNSAALEIFSQVLLLDPDFPGIYLRMGLASVQVGNDNDSVQWYQRAVHYFLLAARQDREDQNLWLEWGLALIHLANYSTETSEAEAFYCDAEKKILMAGRLGNPHAYYHLAGLYSLLDRTELAMQFIEKAFHLRFLPSIDEMLEDEWLDNLRSTDVFVQFLSAIESKQHQLREE